MKNKVFEINVDFETKSAVDTDLIKIVKGDYNSIEFDLKMDKTDYQRAVLFLVKPSKKNFVVDIANSKAIFTEKNTFDEIGIYYYGIVLYGTNSKLTTSTKGKIQVVDGYNEDNEDITGDENYPILDTLIEEVTDLKNKINASLGVMNKTFKEVTYDASTGVMSFKNLNNEVTNINLPLSLLISSASYDNDNKKIVLTLANNDTIDIPILDLVSNYYDDKINANKEYIASTSNELYRLKTDVLETGESSGNNIHLEDSALSEIQEISVDGVCKQETTTGKQLLDYDNLTNNGQLTKINPYGFKITGTNAWMSGNFTIDLKANTKYTFKCLFNQIDAMSTIEVSIREESGKIIKDLISSKKNGTLIGSFTTETITKITFYLYSNLNATPMTTTCDFTCLQIVEGEYTDKTMPDFEPFTGNQPSPNPNFPQNISVLTGNLKLTSCGKNLFKMGTVNDYDYNNRITNITADKISIKLFESGLTFTYNKLNKFKGNKIYYITALSEVSNARFFIRLRNSDDTGWLSSNDVNLAGMEYISSYNGWYYNCSDINMKKIISIPDCLYWELGFGFHSSAGTKGESYTISNIMVSNTDSSYEPYQGSSLNIAIPSNEFVGKLDDTYKDTLNIVYKDDGHYHLILKKMIGKVVLNGSEGNIYAFYENPGDYNQINATLGITNIDTTNKYSFLCNYFGYYEKATGNKTRSGMVKYGTNPNFVFSVPKKIINATSAWVNWISTHNVIIYYPFATSYEVDLGIVDQLLTFDEITNIFTNSDLIPIINVKYYRNFIKTIQNLQINNDTLKNELVSIESRLTALENANTSAVDNNPTAESEVTE